MNNAFSASSPASTARVSSGIGSVIGDGGTWSVDAPRSRNESLRATTGDEPVRSPRPVVGDAECEVSSVFGEPCPPPDPLLLMLAGLPLAPVPKSFLEAMLRALLSAFEAMRVGLYDPTADRIENGVKI